MATTSCVGANGFAINKLRGTPFDAHSTSLSPVV